MGVRFGPIHALHAVDLEIGRGETVALAGENGAGKSTLVRCIAGDLAPGQGQIWLGGRPLPADPRAAARRGVAVVWQDLALCDNLDVAANLLLGRERLRLLLSDARFHARAAELLAELGIPIPDTTRQVATLSGGQRQLVAVARAMRDQPQLLVLDEPTASLGMLESAQVEDLTRTLRDAGTTILLVSHDIDQMFRLADRVVVLRHGCVVGEVDPGSSHPDDVVALLSGQEPDASARSQLSRLHGLSDRLASADPSSSLPLILSVLGAALGADRLSIHLIDGELLRCAAALGFSPSRRQASAEVPLGVAGGPIGKAAASGAPEVVSGDTDGWASVPVFGATGVVGVITVIGRGAWTPSRDELDLMTLYAGYAANAIERERLLGALTDRNRILETIREVLEILAGPARLADGLGLALQALRAGLRTDEVSLVAQGEGHALLWRAHVDEAGVHDAPPAEIAAVAVVNLFGPAEDGRARRLRTPSGSGELWAAPFATPGGPTALLAQWREGAVPVYAAALVEAAANSLRLALEREESERAHREATTLRRTQHLQQQFLSRLSHELRTPLTAIRGYASSLLQPDVTWDRETHDRFLSRISAESARLGRLVDDLLDFSAIRANILRLQPDWCDLALVLDAARACLPPANAHLVELRCPPDLPPLWGDHDRLEQVFVNLLDNAVRHNSPGTRVEVSVAADPPAGVMIVVSDDGAGFPDGLVFGQDGTSPPRSLTAGAGLGLSIAQGIIEAHGGRVEVQRPARGARLVVRLPIEHDALAPTDDHE
ncbi:MAG: ATP-binding cassette domain-containing protein [Acidimicrobiaceae bacterium]|nr:ATP-binding cassette domain-containing protein [Acidimicrobiaceae bacterium]